MVSYVSYSIHLSSTCTATWYKNFAFYIFGMITVGLSLDIDNVDGGWGVVVETSWWQHIFTDMTW